MAVPLLSVTGRGLRNGQTQLMSPALHCMACLKYVFKRTILCGSCLQREVLLNLSPLRTQNLFATACQHPEHEEETHEADTQERIQAKPQSSIGDDSDGSTTADKAFL